MATLAHTDFSDLNGVQVPVVREAMALKDPYELAGDLTLDWKTDNTIEVGLVFNNWIGKALGLNRQWWNKHVTQVILLQEINALLLGHTKKPKQHAFSMPLKVRGKVLLVHESHGLLNLALSGSREEQICTLTWFLKELEKDLQTLKQAELDDEPVPP